MSERKVLCFLASMREELYAPPFVCLKIVPCKQALRGGTDPQRLSRGDHESRNREGHDRGHRPAGWKCLGVCHGKDEQISCGESHDDPAHLCCHGDHGRFSELPEPEMEEISGTVSSVRLDSVIALCGRLSRTRASSYIEGEKVSVNGLSARNVSLNLRGGEILSIRGIGKFRFWRARKSYEKGADICRCTAINREVSLMITEHVNRIPCPSRRGRPFMISYWKILLTPLQRRSPRWALRRKRSASSRIPTWLTCILMK